MEAVYFIVLIPMVYLAVAVFVLGTAIRLVHIIRQPSHPTTLQIYPVKKPAWLWALHDTFLFPTVRKHKPIFWMWLMIFHVGLLLLFIGHLELIWDLELLQVIPHDVFLGNGLIGLILSSMVADTLIQPSDEPL